MASTASKAFLTHSKRWYLVDAKGQKVGRLAAQLATVLQGKTKPIFHPSQLCGDHVVVVNAQDVVFTGDKWTDKVYRHHTGYPGGFRERRAFRVHERDGTSVLRRAVSGMLPKNNLRKKWMRHLHLFEDETHPYGASIFAELTPPQPAQPRLPKMLKPMSGDEWIEALGNDFELLSTETFDLAEMGKRAAAAAAEETAAAASTNNSAGTEN